MGVGARWETGAVRVLVTVALVVFALVFWGVFIAQQAGLVRDESQ